MRSDLLAIAIVAAATAACSSSKFDPLLPIDEAGLAYLAAHCAVPVKVTRRTVGEGDSARVLIEHRCSVRGPTGVQLGVEYDEANRQIVDIGVALGASTVAEADASFESIYAGFIEPFIDPSRRANVRSMSADGPTESDPDEPAVFFRRSKRDEPYPTRSLTIGRHIKGVQ